MNLKKLLFQVHRWLGIGMCLLFALWFASGIIMMYVEYPELTEAERVANLPALNTAEILIPPVIASESRYSRSAVSNLKLTTTLNRPAYQFQSVDGSLSTVFADNGELLSGVNEASAVAAARASGFAQNNAQPTYDQQIDMDQWSISAELNPLRPLHRVQINNSAGTVVYVSSVTGQIVLDTASSERFWNWLGSTIHWIYPMQLRKNAALWNQVIVYLSLVGIVSVITGGIIGFMRLSLRRYKNKSVSPYTTWMKWHHLLGLMSLLFVSTFIFSGLMSMGPWGIFNSVKSAQPQINRYVGSDIYRLSELTLPDFTTMNTAIKEVEWHKIQNIPYLVLTGESQEKIVTFNNATSLAPSSDLRELIDNAIPELLPDAELISVEVITAADNYYYSRHNNDRPLPVYRAKFADDESTWYHINLSTGELVNRVTDASRRERWLFNGLHSLDFQLLLQHRPLWDILVIFLSIVGLGFSLTSVVIGWRRLFD